MGAFMSESNDQLPVPRKDFLPVAQESIPTTPQQSVQPHIQQENRVQSDASQIPPKFGGFWIRFVAFIIDAAIIKIVLGIVFLFTFGQFFPESTLTSHGGNSVDRGEIFMVGMPLTLLTIAAWWLYYSLFESSKLQATPGKLATGLKVVDLNYTRISWGRANARYWSKLISAFIIYIGFFMIGWTKRKQGLHDKVAETLVIKSCKK